MTHITNAGQIRCVSFDAGGTLIHLIESVGTTYSRIAEQYGIEVEPVAIDQSFRKVWKKTLPAFHPEGPEITDEKQWWRALVLSVFQDALGLEQANVARLDLFSEFFQHLYQHYREPGVWKLDPEAVVVLDGLEKQGIKVAMISNFDERLAPILEHMGIGDRFDPLVVSNQIRASKPSPKIFRYAMEQLNLQAHEVLHVGDDLECDHKGAIAVGMQSLLVGKNFGNLTDVLKITENRDR